MKKHVLTLAALVMGITGYSADVSIDDYSADTTITQDEFANAQTAAGNGGIIRFAAKWYKTYETLSVTKSNLSIIGEGKSSSYITYKGTDKLNAIIIAPYDGFTAQEMHIRGGEWPTYNNTLDVNEGTRVATGVEAGLRVTNGSLNIKAVGVEFSKVSVGIEYQNNTLPDGLEVTDCVFITGRSMINAHNEEAVDYTFLSPMKIDNADFIYEPGHGARGIVCDFGNADAPDPIDLNDSYIKNSNMDKMTNWQIGFCHGKNLLVENNDLFGGGAGEVRTSFSHTVHFEDSCSNITVNNNRLYQRPQNDAGDSMTNTSHIWVGGDNGVPQLTVTNNTMTGTVTVGSLSGCLNNWEIHDNQFNLDSPLPNYIINGWIAGSSITQSGNTVNGAAIIESQIQVVP